MAHLRKPFDSALEDLINEHGVDAQCGIPDYILAAYMVQSLEPLKTMIKSNDKHNGVEIDNVTISKVMVQQDMFDRDIESQKHAAFNEDLKIKKI